VAIGAGILIGRERAQGTKNEAGPVATRPTAEDAEPIESGEPAQSVDEAVVSDAVLTLTDPATDYRTRLDAMGRLGYEIPEQDIEAIKDFLLAGIPGDVKIPRGACNSVRNDLYDMLLRQKTIPEGMGNLLADVVSNPEQDSMWRNYCIQFMPEFYEKHLLQIERQKLNAGSGQESVESVKSTDELSAIHDAMFLALDERDNSNAGTALLGLERLSRNFPEFDREEIDAAMLDLASDDQASVANRITAIRMCGDQGNAQALDTARDLAQNGDTTMLRCAAIATLGELGTEDDLALLETYASSADERIQRIAQNSLEKLASE